MEKIEQKIRYTYKELAKKSPIMPREIPYLFFTSGDNGTPHIEYTENGKFYIVATERGNELERQEANDMEELMYLVFKELAEGYGVGYEFRNRRHGEDSRRLYFETSVRELRNISSEWADRLSREFDEVLAEHPYRDTK